MSRRRRERLERVQVELQGIIDRARDFERRYEAQLAEVHRDQRLGALNFVHYLAIRQTDTAWLHDELTELGLSTVEGSESHALASVQTILRTVRQLLGEAGEDATIDAEVDFGSGPERILRHTEELLGPKRVGAPSRIMVTLPSEAADDFQLVYDMMAAGMNCARVNCAHDGPEQWQRMIGHVRRASEELDRPCRVFMDLAGPKIRIGAIAPGPQVLRVDPWRDARGVVRAPARVRFVPDGTGAKGGDGLELPVSAEVVAAIAPERTVEIADTAGVPVSLRLLALEDGVGVAEYGETAWFETGAEVAVRDPDGLEVARGRLGTLPGPEPRMVLHVGDVLVLHKDDRPGEAPRRRTADAPAEPGHISCSMPQIVDALEIGHPVFLDDGKIAAEVVARRPDEVDVKIVRAGLGGSRLKGFKGLNLPESRLGLFGLTDKDREDLRFVVRHADGVNVSFINHPDDVEDVLDELEAVGGQHLGLVLKIETRGGVNHLPGILLASLEWPSVGVMVARGDLAVEAGWLELAEVIEEILFLCEAAHVPTIWATEVLDRLAKKGVPSRGEVSDVIMAGRAECIMLNKGPYITRAIRGLDELLSAFQAYRDKKSTRLPALQLDLPDPAEVGRTIGAR